MIQHRPKWYVTFERALSLALDVLTVVSENRGIHFVEENTGNDKVSGGAVAGGGDVVEHRHPEQDFDVDIRGLGCHRVDRRKFGNDFAGGSGGKKFVLAMYFGVVQGPFQGFACARRGPPGQCGCVLP